MEKSTKNREIKHEHLRNKTIFGNIDFIYFCVFQMNNRRDLKLKLNTFTSNY